MSQNNNLRTNLAAARPQHLEPITFLSSASQSQSQQQQNVDLYNNNQNNNNNNLRSRLETFLTNSQRLIPVSSSLSNSAHHNRSSMSLSQNQNQNQQEQPSMLNNNSNNSNTAMMVSDFGYFKRISLFGGSTSSSSSQLRDPSSAFGGFGLGRGAGGTKSISASPAFPFLNVNQIPSADIYTARGKMNDLISQNEHEATKNTRNNNATNNIYSSKGKEIPDYQMLAEVVKYEKDLARARALEQQEAEEEELESLRKLRRKKQNDLEFGTRQHEKKRTKSFFLRSKLKPEERRNISAEEAFEMALQNVHRFERDRIGINMQKRLKEEFNNNQDGNTNANKSLNKNNRQASFLLTSKAAVAEMKTANVNSHVHQTQTPLQGMNRRRREWELQQLEQDERLFNEAKESEETSKLQEKALRQIKLKEEVFDVFRQFREGRKENNNNASPGEQNNNIRQRQGETSTMVVPQNSANNNNNKKKSVLEMAFSDDDDE